MAKPATATGLAMGLSMALILWAAGVAAQTPLSSSCTNVLLGLSPCLSYISGNSSTPSSGCCTQLANVVRTSPNCLCQVLNGAGSSLGLNINQTQAMTLPAACKVQTPPISQCKAASPASTPGASSPTGSTESPDATPAGSGSKATPTTEGGSSDGHSTQLSFALLVSLLFAASYTFVFTSS